MRSPIRWAGGKSRLRKYILPLIPSDHKCYVEPFSGAAWVLFGKEPSDVEVINDIDGELINFFRVVRDEPEKLISSFEWELVSRAEFERLAKADPVNMGNVERAHRFYYLIMAGWGAEGDFPRFATSTNDGGHGNRLFGGLKTLEKRILPAYERLSTVIIENLDWRECMSKYDSADTVMYVDPPYLRNGVNYKHNMRSYDEHKELAEALKTIKARWLLSAYDNDEMRSMFSDYSFVQASAYSGLSTRKNNKTKKLNKEIIIKNF